MNFMMVDFDDEYVGDFFGDDVGVDSVYGIWLKDGGKGKGG